MNEISLEEACGEGLLYKLLEDYIISCAETSDTAGNSEASKGGRKLKKRFPNAAGFCRYCGIGETEYDCLAAKYPAEFQRIQAVFEDEALNSEVSPTILTAYLKKWIGYDKSPKGQVCDGQIKIVFDHDIMEDGK